jgi:hypothetical protein
MGYAIRDGPQVSLDNEAGGTASTSRPSPTILPRLLLFVTEQFLTSDLI